MGWLSSQLSALSYQPSHVQDSENSHKKAQRGIKRESIHPFGPLFWSAGQEPAPGRRPAAAKPWGLRRSPVRAPPRIGAPDHCEQLSG